MARRGQQEYVTVDEEEAAEPKVKLDPATARIVRMLREVGTCYRDAAKALAFGDDIECDSQLEVAGKMLEVYYSLAKKRANELTAEGLEGVDAE